MGTGHLIAFIFFSVAAAGTPGPSNLVLTSTGAAVGLLRGLPALFGQVFGVGFMMFLMALGLGSLILQNSLILQGLKWGGIVFLLWLAWKIATANHTNGDARRTHMGFWALATFQWVNPKSWLICASAVSAYYPAEAGSTIERATTLALLFAIVALPSSAIWLGAGASLQRLLRRERFARGFNYAMGALLAGSVVIFVH